METTYEAVAKFAQTWGLIYFVAIFLVVLVHVMWPSRKKGYEEAARMPLRED